MGSRQEADRKPTMPTKENKDNDSLLWYLKRFSTGLFKPVPFSSMPQGVFWNNKWVGLRGIGS